jgi:MFS family permease
MHNVQKLKITSFLWALVFYMPIISLYMLDNGVPLAAIVLSQVSYSLFSILGEVPTGILADKYGHKESVVTGYLINGFAALILLFFPSLVGLYLATSLFAIGDTFLSGSKEALLYESSKDKRLFQRHYSSLLSYEILGFAISALIAGAFIQLTDQNNYEVLIIAAAAAKFLAAMISLSLKNVYIPIEDKAKGPEALTLLKQSVKLIKTNKVVFTMAAVTVLTLNGEYFMYSVYQPYFEAANVDPFFIGFVLSAGAFLNFIFTRNAYKLEKHLALNAIILSINVILGVSYVAMALFVNPVALVGLFIVMNGLYNVQIPVISDYINGHTDSSIRATVLSGIGLIKHSVQIFVRIILGVLVGVIGTSNTMLTQGIYLIIGAWISYILISKLADVSVKHRTEAV